MKKFIVANWKMCGGIESSRIWAEKILSHGQIPADKEAVVCPPDALLTTLKDLLSNSRIKLGGQDCHFKDEGAYTGETSAKLLKDVGCEYVIVGHSERRNYLKESNETVRDKAANAIKNGLIPIICIGETAGEREKGRTIKVIREQIAGSIPDEAGSGNFLLAYEPVWAIGSGKLPTMDEINEVHTAIKTDVSERKKIDAAEVYVLYGGSVKPDNAGEILRLSSVSGVLVGGASLNADDFYKIILG
jgi:triosephosphate isomerase (TIM)